MSETILNWIKTQFDNKIYNIENDFSNGYNFGKLLCTNNLFNNMKELKNTNDKEDSLNNYSLLRKALDQIDVHLTDSDINELINKKKYKAELYLFKIKQKLSLQNCQFNEIMEKMNQESITNKKVNFDLILKNKRNQSAKPNFTSKNFNINGNNLNNNLTSTNRNSSANKNKKITFTNYTARLKSAKLPNLNKNKESNRKRQITINDNNKDDEQEILEEKQIQSVLNDITIFENIHMNKNKIKVGMNKNPWDRSKHSYNPDSLFNKKNEERKKITIFDLIDENKKDNNNITNTNIIFDNKIEKLKSTLHNHNQFNVDNKKSYINKKNFEDGLSRMGLNANTMLPSIAKIKDKNIPSQIVMKSINDTIKEKNLQKKNLLNNINNNSPKNKDIYIPSTTTNKKTKSQQLEKPFTDNIKRPFSSATTYNNKTKNKKSKLNIDDTKKI